MSTLMCLRCRMRPVWPDDDICDPCLDDRDLDAPSNPSEDE